MEKKSPFKFVYDGWVNFLTGLGKRQDKTQYTKFGNIALLDDQTLGFMYMGDGYAKKIVAAPADDMIREWIKTDNDNWEKIEEQLKNLKAMSIFNKALRWQRLYGGSLIIIGAMDGQELEEPLNIKRTKAIEWLKVVDKSQVFLDTSIWIEDPMKPNYGQIEQYQIQLGPTKKQFSVHRSRVLEFFGEPVPDNMADLDLRYRYWGVSILQLIYDNLKNYSANRQSVSNIMLEFIVGKYKIANLAEMLASGQENRIQARMEIINMCKSVINGVLLDETEDYTRDSASVGGLAELLDRCMMDLSGVSEIPVTRLFGRSPAGQNATGDADLRNYYDMISAKQETVLRDPLQTLVDMIAEVYKIPSPNIIEFNSLYDPNEMEQAEIDRKNAETDNIYMESSVLYSNEVREMRFPELEQIARAVESEENEKE